MTVLQWARTLTLALSLPLLMGITGCSQPAPDAAAPVGNPPDVARAYADCLTAEAIDGVFIDDDGYVGINISVSSVPPEDGGSDGSSALAGAGAALSTALDAATEKCKKNVPAYHENNPSDDPAIAADLLAESRAFAACARKNGLTQFPDPDASAGSKLMVPEGTTKGQFLATVTACAATLSGGEHAADSGGGANGGGGAGSDGSPDGAITITAPNFGGAYDSAWTPEVMNILFGAMSSTSIAP